MVEDTLSNNASSTRAFVHEGMKSYLPSSGVLLLLGSIGFCYWTTLVAMIGQWWSNDIYSYAFLIPAISLYMIWLDREGLMAIPPVPEFVKGGGILLCGMLGLVLGNAGNILLLQECSFLVTLTGLVVLVRGSECLSIVWFPILYLAFAIPMWGVIVEPFVMPSRLLSASIASALLQAVGIPNFHQGIYIQLPTVMLEVARECSGVNYLIAVTTLSIPVGMLYLKGWSKRIVLLFSALVIAWLTNGLRIAAIGFNMHFNISDDSHGPFHIFQGLLVSGVGFLAILGILCILRRGGHHPKTSALGHVHGGRQCGGRFESGVGYRRAVGVGALLLLIVGGYLSLPIQPVPIYLKLDHFPSNIGPWGSTAANDQELRALASDELLARHYYSTDQAPVQLYIAYFAVQSQSQELTGYEAETFLRGEEPVEIGVQLLAGLEMRRTLQRRGNSFRLVLSWYEIDGESSADTGWVLLHTIQNGIVHRRTNGALVAVACDLDNIEKLPACHKKVETFIQSAMPEIKRFLTPV